MGRELATTTCSGKLAGAGLFPRPVQSKVPVIRKAKSSKSSQYNYDILSSSTTRNPVRTSSIMSCNQSLSLSSSSLLNLNDDQIAKLDGNLSTSNLSSSNSSNDSDSSLSDQSLNDTCHEFDNVPSPAVFNVSPSGTLEIVDSPAPNLPLIIGTNFRSVGNKQNSVNKLLSELGPDLLMGDIERMMRERTLEEDAASCSTKGGF